jgi:hypothetical protein
MEHHVSRKTLSAFVKHLERCGRHQPPP